MTFVVCLAKQRDLNIALVFFKAAERGETKIDNNDEGKLVVMARTHGGDNENDGNQIDKTITKVIKILTIMMIVT